MLQIYVVELENLVNPYESTFLVNDVRNLVRLACGLECHQSGIDCLKSCFFCQVHFGEYCEMEPELQIQKIFFGAFPMTEVERLTSSQVFMNTKEHNNVSSTLLLNSIQFLR